MRQRQYDDEALAGAEPAAGPAVAAVPMAAVGNAQMSRLVRGLDRTSRSAEQLAPDIEALGFAAAGNAVLARAFGAAQDEVRELEEDSYVSPRSQTDTIEGDEDEDSDEEGTTEGDVEGGENEEEQEEDDETASDDTAGQAAMRFGGLREAVAEPGQSGPGTLVRQGGGGAPAQPLPSPDTIVGDSVVSWALVMAWNDSNPNAPEVQRGRPGSTKHEQGGWILQNPATGALSVQRVAAGTRDGLGTIVGTRPADSPTQRVVAWFHTHPNTSTEGYVSDPSPGDIAWQAAEAHVPGIILTHDGTKFIPFP